MTAKESSGAIWRQEEDQGLGSHTSPAPRSEPMTEFIVSENPSSAFLQQGEADQHRSLLFLSRDTSRLLILCACSLATTCVWHGTELNGGLG